MVTLLETNVEPTKILQCIGKLLLLHPVCLWVYVRFWERYLITTIVNLIHPRLKTDIQK